MNLTVFFEKKMKAHHTIMIKCHNLKVVRLKKGIKTR